MDRMNADCGTWVTHLLEIRPNDEVLEVGFGPGVVIERLAKRANAEQARARNATAVQDGRVKIRHSSVESLPFDDNSFHKALAINSMQYWPRAVTGLRGNTAGDESWRKNRALLYALFRAAE
jgi:ubiquinone/menaquinone biosynthesis C-methylase UbiE